jgi:enoyl-CoA hydratase/carnithine racemase
MSAPQTVRVEHPEPGVAILRLYRPDQLNALNTVMLTDAAAGHCRRERARIVGVGQAAEIMLTGKRVDAAEAARIGLVNRVVPADQLLAEATAMAQAITRFSPFGTALSKRALYANLDAPPLHAALEVESRGQAFATRDPGFPEALAAVRAQVLRAAPDRLRTPGLAASITARSGW